MSAFVAVADLRGFAPAARRLKRSPSAVTRMIAGLEDALGTRLLQRTTRSVTLTDAGARYLERARRILADVAEAESVGQAARSVPAGRFVVTAPNVFGRLHVAPLMSAYMSAYPAVQGELILTDRVVNLVEEGIDAAVRIGSLEDASHVARKVGATRRVLVAAPKYLKRRTPPRSPHDVTGHELIQCTGIHPIPEWRFARAGKELRIPYRPRYVTSSADVAISHAEFGGGLTMVLAYQVIDALRARRLRVLLAEFELPAQPIHIVYPSTRLLSATVRAFIDLVTTTCDWQFVDL